MLAFAYVCFNAHVFASICACLLLRTQPANALSSKPKKHPKSICSKISSNPVNKANHQN